MNLNIICALISLLPGVGLAVSYPRRSWAAAVIFAAALAAGAWVVFFAGAPPAFFAAAGWSVLGCGYAWFACVSSQRQFEQRQKTLEDARALARRTQEDLDKVKGLGLEASREQKETLALYGLIKGLTEALSWEEMRPRLESAVEEALGISDFAFYVATAEPSFKTLVARGLSGSPGSSWVTLERYFQEHGLSLGQPHLLENPEKAAAVPIQDGELLGYFYARVPPKFSAAELLLKASTFAQEIAFAFRRIRIFQEMENLSRIDGLTGVHRRGDFDERLRDEVVRAQTFKTSLSLLLLDIDHFKDLNDRYGHPFGDQVLRRLGEILNSLVYDTDFVARYGGEEFVIILPRAQVPGAARKAEAIRKAVEEERFAAGFESVRTSVSIGLAHFPRDGAAGEELVGQADAALYRAKSQGRNRVVDCATLRS